MERKKAPPLGDSGAGWNGIGKAAPGSAAMGISVAGLGCQVKL